MKQNPKHLTDFELFKYYEKLYKSKKFDSNGSAYQRMLYYLDKYKQIRRPNNAT